MTYMCPICGADMHDPPEHCNICACCGTEFEIDDVEYTYEELRQAWISRGMNWWYDSAPENWNPYTQLARLNIPSAQSTSK